MYVCGFAFDPATLDVLLIRKLRPLWQAGRLNGIGGKVEEGETPIEAMVREFREETGLEVGAGEWEHLATLTGEGWKVLFFRAFTAIAGASSPTDEVVGRYALDDVSRLRVIPNLRWVVPLAAFARGGGGVALPLDLRAGPG